MMRRYPCCGEAARQTGGEVAEFRISSGPTRNFHQGTIAYQTVCRSGLPP